MRVLEDLLQLLRELMAALFGLPSSGAAPVELAPSLSTALGALESLVLIGCTAVCALRLARWFVPRAGLPLRWSTAASLGMFSSALGFHALLALHAFRPFWALVGCVALTFGVARALPRRGGALGVLRAEARALRLLYKRSRRSWLNACFGACAALLALRALIVPPLGWDYLTYHGPRAALWVQSGQFSFDPGVGCYDYYRNFFAGGEIFTAWAMLPFHSDLLANLASVAQWIALGLASWALARAIGLREPFASTSACAVMFAPTVQFEVNSGYVELALNATLLQGIALATHCLRRPEPRALIACAISLGIAASIKLPALPPALIVAALLALRLLASRRFQLRAKLATLLVASACALLPALPFMLHAYRETGYPLSPFPVRVFSHTLGVASAMMRWYQSRPELHPYSWPAERPALLAIFSPLAPLNESLGVLFLIPLAAFPFGLAWLARRKPLVALALGCAALAPVLVHASPSMEAVRLVRSVTTSRFLIPTLALVVPIGLTWCRPGRFGSRAYRALLLCYPALISLFALRRGFGEWENRELALVAIAIVQASLLLGWLRRTRPRAALAFGLAFWVAGLCALQVRRDATRPLAYERSFALHGGMPLAWTRAVQLVDEPDRAHRIAITGGPDHNLDKWFQYFFLGRRFQNTLHYVPPTRDGSVAQFGPGGDLDARADMASWEWRLTAEGITEVLSFAPPSIELRHMERTPARFERLADDSEFGLYRVKP